MSVLYRLDANYETLTAAGTAELVPQVELPYGDSLPVNTIFRGRLAGKVSTPGPLEAPEEAAENPKTARLRVAISPHSWGQRQRYKVGDRVTADGLKVYKCVTAGISEAEGFTLNQKDRLMAYWPMHDLAGSAAYDHSGNDYNLTDVAYGSKYEPSGKGDRCLSFDGSTGYANGAIGAMSADWSYALRIKPKTLPAAGATSMVMTLGTYVELYLTNPASVPTLTVAWRDSGGVARTLAYIVTLNTDTWYHIAATHYGKTTRLYINGAQVAEELLYDSYNEVGTGGIYFGRDTTAANYYKGSVNEARLYSRGLSAAEVLYLYRLPVGITALNNRTELGPAGRKAGIADGTVSWDYVRDCPVVLDTGDMPLEELQHDNAPWLFEFEIQTRRSLAPGSVMGTVWYGAAVGTGRYTAGNLAALLLLPTEGPFASDVVTTDANVLHVLYTVDFVDGSITCMTYVLEVL